MLTGATLLWRRLKSPRVVKSIKLGADFITFKSCPRFLREFPSLEELLIHSYTNEWSHKLGLKIDSVPSGVRKLVLRGRWARSINVDTMLEGGEHETWDLSKHLPYLETLDLSAFSRWVVPFWTHSPQSLTTLCVPRWSGDELPSSLIHFEAVDVFISTLLELPPSLETFVVRNKLDGAKLVVQALPVSIRKLYLGRKLSFPDDIEWSQTFLEQLPKSLTWFEIPAHFTISFLTNPEVASSLPLTLTELHIAKHLPCSAWPFLPRNLKKLSFLEAPELFCTEDSAIFWAQEIRSIPFGTLPRSITSLELLPESDVMNQYLCGPPSSIQSYFPPHLTYLDAARVQLSPETVKLLPSSLTYLKIRNLCKRVYEHLPTGLITLIAHRTLMSPNLFKFLPGSLTSFRMSMYSSSENWIDYATGSTYESISELPEYLVHENCVSKSFDWKDCPPLPPRLTCLAISHAFELGDSFIRHHLHQQLPNLLELSMGNSKHFTDLCIPLLSPHLTTLNLRSSSNITGKSFEFLPRCLTLLNLNRSDSIFDSDIQHLPRSLKHAYLKRAIQLTDSCISELPPHLETFCLKYNSQISPSSVPYFPYTLRSYLGHSSAEFFYWSIRGGEISP